jgi:hypothetical protein
MVFTMRDILECTLYIAEKLQIVLNLFENSKLSGFASDFSF